MHYHFRTRMSDPRIRRIIGRTRCVDISRGIAFEHHCLVSYGEWATRRRVHGRNGHAKTRRTQVVANLRNEAIARVVPSVRRAYARSFGVPDARRLPRWREQREARARNLSFSSRTRSSGVVRLSGRDESN